MEEESDEVQYAEDGENDPNSVLPIVLFEQESHELICPVCDHSVTGEVILQKRKRAAQSGGRPHGIQASPQKGDPWQSSSPTSTKDSLADSGDEEEEKLLERTLEEQANYDLLCPDCETCITHDVILQKRKRATSTAGDSLPQGKPSTERPGAHTDRGHSRSGRRHGKEIVGSEDDDPPLKRHRRSDRRATLKDREGKEIRRTLQNQRIYDLTCPDCTSHITYQVILNKRTSASGQPVGFLEKRGRRSRKSASSIDDNPWRTRYKLTHGHSRPDSAAKADELQTKVSLFQAKLGPATAQRSPEQQEKLEDPQSQGAKNGTGIATRSTAQSEERKDPIESQAAKYGTAVVDMSLTEPLLQVEQVPKREFACWHPGLPYFVIFLLLYLVMWVLRSI